MMCPSPISLNQYNGTTYALTGAGVDIYPAVPSFEVSIVSSSINVPNWTGTGHIVWFDLTPPPPTQGAPGTYDWAFTGGFELWDAGISFNYVADTDLGTWLGADSGTAYSGDYVTISVESDTLIWPQMIL